MKRSINACLLSVAFTVLSAVPALGVVVHRSFRNGYPSGAQGVTARPQPQPAALKAPKVAQGGVRVVTNRVALTREQADRLLKAKKGSKARKNLAQ